MKTISLELDNFLLDFYAKIAESASRSTEQVLSDVLTKFAGDACAEMAAAKNSR